MSYDPGQPPDPGPPRPDQTPPLGQVPGTYPTQPQPQPYSQQPYSQQPYSQQPYSQQPYPSPYTYPGLQVVTLPGGLSGAAHAVHIVIVLLTCLLWLPVYVIIALNQPLKRVQVSAPYGTPQEVIDAARAEAMRLTPVEQRNRNTRNIVIVAAFVAPAAVCGLVFLFWSLAQPN